MVRKLFSSDKNFVTRPTVQVSEYSEENGGSDSGTLYAVEVLFPDGTSVYSGFYRDLPSANTAAKTEAAARGAELLSESVWPNRQVRA